MFLYLCICGIINLVIAVWDEKQDGGGTQYLTLCHAHAPSLLQRFINIQRQATASYFGITPFPCFLNFLKVRQNCVLGKNCISKCSNLFRFQFLWRYSFDILSHVYHVLSVTERNVFLLKTMSSMSIMRTSLW